MATGMFSSGYWRSFLEGSLRQRCLMEELRRRKKGESFTLILGLLLQGREKGCRVNPLGKGEYSWERKR